jgi:uncharacterized protein YbbK (DUF523 family)
MDHFSDTANELDPARFYRASSAQYRAPVAVSACLTGQHVRYDGRGYDLPAIEWLAGALSLRPICPEVGAGLTVPRPPVQLVASNMEAQPRARGRDDSSLDVTQKLLNFAEITTAQPTVMSMLCGYIWKSRSPSCGLDSTPLFDTANVQIGRTSGIQAAHFQRTLPWLSYCEESALIDRRAARVFVLRCRLVFDVMYAEEADLPAHLQAQHRHYHFLTERFSQSEQIALSECAAADRRTDYLTLLQHGCSRLQPEQLLELFINIPHR